MADAATADKQVQFFFKGIFMSSHESNISAASSQQQGHSLSMQEQEQLLAALEARASSGLSALQAMVQDLPAHIQHRLARIGAAKGAQPNVSDPGMAFAIECYELSTDVQDAMGLDYLQKLDRCDEDLKAACRQWAREAHGISQEAFSRFLQTTMLPAKYLVEAAGTDSTRVMLIVKHLVKTFRVIPPDVVEHSEVRHACRVWGLELVSDLAPSGAWQRFLAQLCNGTAPEFVLALVALTPKAATTPAPLELRDYLAADPQVAARTRALMDPLAGVLDVTVPMYSLAAAGGKSIRDAIVAQVG